MEFPEFIAPYITPPEKKMKSDVDYANLALDLFKGFNKWRKTDNIMVECGIPKTSRDTLLKHLTRLMDRQILERSGSGSKYIWRSLVSEWDRKDPFRRPPGASHPSPVYPTPTWPEVKDETAQADLQQKLDALAYEHDTLKTAMANMSESATQTIKDLTAFYDKKLSEAGRLHKVVEFKQYKGPSVKLTDVLLPAVFDDVRDLVRCRRNVLLVGPAGCGKTHLCRLVSDSFGFERFGTMSCTEGVTESHLFGKAIPDLTKGENRFEGTDFLECFEKGGMYLLDELDAANSNFVLSLNTALANGYATVQARKAKRRAVKHPDFVCVGSANTFGKGANRQYVGRNQLDEATLDRFRIGIVEMDYDAAVEKHLCPDDALRERLVRIRDRCRASSMLRIISTRFMADAYTMKIEAEWNDDKIVKVLTQGWSTEEKAKALSA